MKIYGLLNRLFGKTSKQRIPEEQQMPAKKVLVAEICRELRKQLKRSAF